MPLLIILGILLVYGISALVDALTPEAPPRCHETMEKISREMVGKSAKECRDVLKKYR